MRPVFLSGAAIIMYNFGNRTVGAGLQSGLLVALNASFCSYF